jgi:pimeloyl-ACP methyl ester carboxylesterase
MFNIPLSGPTLNVLRKFHVYREDSVEYSFESIADRLFDTINSISKEKQFTGKIYVIGESFGGFIAQVYAAKYQSKESRLEKLVLLSALAKTELTFSVEMKKRFALPIVKALGLIYPRLAQYVFAVVHQFDVVESSEPQYLFDFFVREASAAHHFSVMRRLELAISADISNSSSSISIPTLLIYGKDDQFTQHGTRHLSQLLQTSKSIYSLWKSYHFSTLIKTKVSTKK